MMFKYGALALNYAIVVVNTQSIPTSIEVSSLSLSLSFPPPPFSHTSLQLQIKHVSFKDMYNFIIDTKATKLMLTEKFYLIFLGTHG